MRRLIERFLARFGFVLLKTQPRVTPEPTLAEACFQFGAREAMLRQSFEQQVQGARFESYHTGYAQGEINGRMALAAELHDEFGYGEHAKKLTDVELQRVIARQVH